MSNPILNEVGWDGGFAVPVANSENKALEDQLRWKERENVQLENKIERHKDKKEAFAEHLKNVLQELSHTQALCTAKERETASEKHFKAIAERETGRLRQEYGKLQSELGGLRENKNTQENTIFKATQKLEELRLQLNWDQETLDRRLEETERKDEETMAIIKYAQQDERRIKSLSLALEKKTLESNQKRKALDNELMETISAQIGLDKTAENFHLAHMERQELIGQWEKTLEQMRKRDAEMQQCALQLAQINQDIREKNINIKEKENFLESEVNNNRENERKIFMAKRQAAKLRQELQEEEAHRTRMQDELNILRGRVDRAATDVESMRSDISRVKKDILEKTNKLEAAKIHNAALVKKLDTVTKTALSVEERAAQMDQLLKDEEQAIKELDVLLHRHREAVLAQKQNLQSLKGKEKDLIALMSGSKAAISHLNSQLSKMDQESRKQQDQICNQDFQLQQLEGKMARLRGEISTEEKEMMEKKTAELAGALKEKTRAANLLSSQLKELEDNIRYVRKEALKTGVENRDLTTKIEELQVFKDTSDKELKMLKMRKQDSMVEVNIFKLELKRVRDLLYSNADNVLSLEKRRLELQTAMREREEEIKVHMKMLGKQVKITEQERQEISAEVHERLSKTDLMRKRYEIMTISMVAPEGEEERSEAYYVVKAAQEREELKRKGDDLNAKIHKMEREMRALDNTIQIVSNCNSSFRRSLHKVQESSPEYQEKLKLEVQKKAGEEKHKYKKRQMKELQEDIDVMSDTVKSVTEEEQMHRDQTEETHSSIVQLNKGVASQKEKLDRATKQCSKLSREIRRTKLDAFDELNIDLGDMKEFNKTVNRMLHEAMEDNPELRAAIERFFLQADLLLPSPVSTPGSRRSSHTSSARSSVSLRSSGSSAGSSPRPSAVPYKCKTIELDLAKPPRASSSASSGSGSSRWRQKSPQ